MDTTTAATQAKVTVGTVRAWCRKGVIAATKAAGRWIIDAASLARRIQIGARRMTEQLSEYLLRAIRRARLGYTPRREDKPTLAGRYVIAVPGHQGWASLPGADVWREHGLIDTVTVNGRTYYVLSDKATRIRAELTAH